jgi:SAM-dependent methyltransferase
MSNGNNFVQKLWNKIKKASIWQNILLFLAIVLIIIMITNSNKPVKEGFVQRERFLLKQGPDIFDNFYVDLYDELAFSQIRNDFEIGTIINKTTPDEYSKILDIGSGRGHHVNTLNNKGFKTIGIDNSPVMIEYAKEKYPNGDFRNIDVLNGMAFGEYGFTHILCLYFTIYYIKNKKRFFENCYKWLVPGGELVLHLVDREEFDAVMPNKNPFNKNKKEFKQNNKRLISDSIVFENLLYKSHFDDTKMASGDIAIFNETFKDNQSGHIRKHEHKFYMPTQKEILAKARDTGFILLAQEEMVDCDYDNHFIYILQKPT